MNETEIDQVWKALSDPTRRRILESLRDGSKTTTEIIELFPDLTRFNVMKHLDVLRTSELVLTEVEGRRRINSLNPEPFEAIQSTWFQRFGIFSESTTMRTKDGSKRNVKRISKLKNKKDFGWRKYTEP
ncbi:MAG: helix-turn-helix transcriptional regulator [Pyrinomonadaceae bacterium]|nr:helix-turn-helix transcriptional regulator [Pyrinomonadaceae bacterium]